MYSYYHGTLRPEANKIRDHNFIISHKIGSLGYGAYAFVGNSGAKNDAREFAWKEFNKKKQYYNTHNKNFNYEEYAPCIINFKLNSTDRILYWNSYIANKYREFMDNPKTVTYISIAITKLKNKFMKQHPKKYQAIKELQKEINLHHLKHDINLTIFNHIGYKNKLDGTIIDKFFDRVNLHTYNKFGKFLGICKLGINKIGDLPPYYGVLPETNLQNSTELCIKNSKVIDYNSIKVYNLIHEGND